MEMHTFCFDAGRSLWRENHVPDFSSETETNLPIILLVDYHDRQTGNSRLVVWCKKHEAYEGIAEYTEEGLLTERGCRQVGMIAKVRNADYLLSGERRYYGSARDTTEAHLRWLVRYCPEEKTVYISHELVEAGFYWKKDQETGRPVNVPFVNCVKHDCDVLCPDAGQPPKALPYVSNNKNDAISLRNPSVHILPPVVAQTALSFLADAAENIYGFRPPLLLPTDTGGEVLWRDNNGAEWVNAFLFRPLDMNIYFFLDFFEREEFDRLFPPDQRDNFPALCEACGVESGEILRAAYRENPAYFLARLALPQLGVRKEKLLETFRDIPAFCGKDVMRRYSLTVFRAGKDAEQSDEWEGLQFYCAWRLESETEEELAKHLLSMQMKWKFWAPVGMKHFRKNFEFVPQELKEEIRRDGITVKTYEHLGQIDNARSFRKENLVYGEKERARECKINGYNIRLIPSPKVFRRLAQIMSSTHFLDHDAKYIPGHTAQYAMERNGRYLKLAYVEDDAILWETGRPDVMAPLFAKAELAFHVWKYRVGLTGRVLDRAGEVRWTSQDFVVEPPDPDPWAGKSMWDMMNAPESEIGRGYFLSFYRKFLEVQLLRSRLPKSDEDEREAMMRKFPCGKRIFDAAWEGNPEAQYVMSLLYRNINHYFASSDVARASEWYKKACENGWREIAEPKDIRL